VRRPSIVLFVVCSLATVLASGLLAQPSRQELRDQLQELKEKQKAFKERLENAQSKKTEARQKFLETREQESNLLELIERYRTLQQQSKQRLETLKQRESQAKKRLQKIDEKFEAAQKTLRNQKNLLLTRLRSIYKQGELMQARTLIGSSNFSEFVTNYRYYQQLVEYDKNLISEYRQAKQQIQQLRDRRREVYQQRKRIRKQVQQTLKKRRNILESRKKFLEEVRNEKELYQRRLNELEQRQKNLKEKVFTFQRRQTTTKQKIKRIMSEFGEQKGELPWPCESRDILRPYGTWREKGIVHNNDGIDIGCGSGARIHAVKSGKVVFANDYQGIGKVVIIRHNKRYLTLYGSLTSIAVSKNQSVGQGTILGRAGQTSGMDQPRLYFQLFEGQKTLNPLEWLE
jgi:septal ring factor EnvC (AmiA/AmiB activator)